MLRIGIKLIATWFYRILTASFALTMQCLLHLHVLRIQLAIKLPFFLGALTRAVGCLTVMFALLAMARAYTAALYLLATAWTPYSTVHLHMLWLLISLSKWARRLVGHAVMVIPDALTTVRLAYVRRDQCSVAGYKLS